MVLTYAHCTVGTHLYHDLYMPYQKLALVILQWRPLYANRIDCLQMVHLQWHSFSAVTLSPGFVVLRVCVV